MFMFILGCKFSCFFSSFVIKL